MEFQIFGKVWDTKGIFWSNGECWGSSNPLLQLDLYKANGILEVVLSVISKPSNRPSIKMFQIRFYILPREQNDWLYHFFCINLSVNMYLNTIVRLRYLTIEPNIKLSMRNFSENILAAFNLFITMKWPTQLLAYMI